MEYQKKIEYANKVASELQGKKTSDEIKNELKSAGLFERDIANIFVSARKMIGEQYQSTIHTFLKEGKDIMNSEEFNSIDQETLKVFIEEEKQKIGIQERRKITKSLKEGKPGYQILEEVDNRFLSHEKANSLLEKVQKVKEDNSSSGRMINFGGGIALFILAGILLVSTGRLFYYLPIIGIGLIIRGLITKKMDYDNEN